MFRWSILATLFFSLSCKKENIQLHVSGDVWDPNLGLALAGVNVVLSGQEISGGSFNVNFNSLASATTNGNGHFEMSFERKTISTYRFQLTRNNYFPNNIEISGDQIRTDETYQIDLEIRPKAWYKIQLRNDDPFDDNDRISYRNTSADLSCECCNNQTVTMLGQQVDTTFTCVHEGENWLQYLYAEEKNGAVQTMDDSIFLVPFDTTFNLISY